MNNAQPLERYPRLDAFSETHSRGRLTNVMSSTNRSTHTSTSFNSQLHGSHESADHVGLNNRQLSSAASESTYVSSPNYSQAFSNSATPSHNTNSTPGESLPEDNTYQLSELGDLDDEFLGVNFDAGVQRVYSIPTTLIGGAGYQSTSFDHALADLPQHPENGLAFQGSNNSAFPLNHNLTDLPNTPHLQSEFNSSGYKSSLTQDEPNGNHDLRFQPLTPVSQLNRASESSTPSSSGDYQSSPQGVDPSTMVGSHTSNLADPQWENPDAQFEPSAFIQTGEHYEGVSHSDYFGGPFPALSDAQVSEAVGLREDEGIWGSSERTGLGPDRRKAIADVEVPNLKDQDEQRRRTEKNSEIQEWRSHAEGVSEVKVAIPDEDETIAPVDDAASIRENKIVGDQVYFNFKHTVPTEADSLLMQQPRHWFDAPSVPYITDTKLQPATANDAIRRWEANADTFSMVSRVATWGTRRRSEPNLAEMDAILDGSFLKKLSISKPKEHERNRSNSILDQGLVRLASIVRNKKDGSRRKRSRSPENAPPSRHEMRSSSISKANAPGLNTTPAALGTMRKHSGSVTPARMSPKSPTHLSFARSVIQRARSRSELSSNDKAAAAGIVDLWRGQGGPPVPSLTTPPLEVHAPHSRADGYDHDEDDDEDDEQADENDVEIKSEEQSEPIVPNYEGFKAHVRRLNPDMDLPECNWLVSRIGRQQETRYKTLLELRVNHIRAVMARNCANRHLCKARSSLLDVKGYGLQPERPIPDLQLVTEFSDDSIPEGGLTSETFPPGVPMPPIRALPADFECQLCFKAKKFQKPSDWTKHVHEDLQPFTCTFAKCKEPKSFKRKADWVRHENERHRRLEWWKCEVNDCGHICYRKDNFLQHLVREHKYAEPLQKTKAAIKKASFGDPAWDMLEKCHHDTTNKPQSEPCKFCGKAFNSWKKLMVHHAKHMEQISLPVLRLVEVANVDGNTIISPIDPNPTPVTPIYGPKMEPSSPFVIESVPLHGPTMASKFSPPAYVPATTSSTMYGLPAQIPQDIDYSQSTMYTNPLSTQPMTQAQSFNFLDPSGMGNMNHTNAFMTTDHGFSSGVPGQSFGTSQPTGYSIPNTYTSDAPAAPGYQVPYVLRVPDQPLYDFDSMAPAAGPNFQQVPRNRAQGGAPSYGYSAHNVPHSGPYYGNPQ
jgi:hypothetical protein